MPGLPLVVRETTNFGCSCGHSGTAEQMCRQQSRVHLTAEEALAAEESLSIYCKPVELYNILQRRAIRNPSFLQRCLYYQIQAKRKKRIQISISFSGTMNAELQRDKVFPMYVLLARPVADATVAEHSSVYRLSRAVILSTFSEHGKTDQTEATFIIPEIKKLTADSRIGDLTIILVINGERTGASGENQKPKDYEIGSFSPKLEGKCLWGKVPLEPLYSSFENCVTLSLGHIADIHPTITMLPCILEPGCLDQDNYLAFQTNNLDSMLSCQVKLRLSAQEIGARDRSPYDSYTYDDVPATVLPHIIRLRSGNVLFNYRYYNNMLQKTEVTEDFSCPFCLVQCASFKGLRYHLTSSHDLFNFEFWVTEEFQAVNVSVRTDAWRSEYVVLRKNYICKLGKAIIGLSIVPKHGSEVQQDGYYSQVVSDGVDPRLQTFFYRSKYKRRRRLKNLFPKVNHVHPQVLELDLPDEAREYSHEDYQRKDESHSSHGPITYSADDGFANGLNKLHNERYLLAARHKLDSYGSENHLTAEFKEPFTLSPDTTDDCCATAQASVSNDCPQPLYGSITAPTTMLQFAKTRKLSVERADPRNRALLQKRQFFHSHRAQPIALEQVFSDRDSEDEVDDDIADFEDRRMLDDFVDVTKYEKQIMHLWNSFVRKQRVLADGHIPWACEAFSQLHGQELVRSPALSWCWRLFMVKLWNHSLLDSQTMNSCNLILERFQNEDLDPEKS